MKVFLDTTVLVAAFTARGLCGDLVGVVLADHILVTGEVNLREFRRVLRQRMKIPADTVTRVEQLLRSQTIIGKPKKPADIPIRDPDDAWVLASALAGEADLLVTGDQDLLAAPRQHRSPSSPRGRFGRWFASAPRRSVSAR